MVQIIGRDVRRSQYTRIPARDEHGPVSIYVKDTCVDYLPTDGPEEQREARARRIALEQGGEVVRYLKDGQYVTWLARCHF